MEKVDTQSQSTMAYQWQTPQSAEQQNIVPLVGPTEEATADVQKICNQVKCIIIPVQHVHEHYSLIFC